MLPIIQSPAQLVEVYGKDAAQTFSTNHALNIIYPPKASETQTARDISEWLGYQTVKGTSESKGKGFFTKKSESMSISDQRRALLLPQEITSLGQGKELVVMENCPPILANKVLYFKDAVFVDRLKEVSPQLQALGNRIPTKDQLDAAIESGELGAPVPKIDLEAHNALIGSEQVTVTVQPAKPTKKFTTIERNVTPADVPNLANLNLAKFALDFSGTEKPINEFDEAALLAYADDLCNKAGIKT